MEPMLKALVAVVVITVICLILKAIAWAYRTARSMSVTDVAHVAGKVTGTVERKASSIAEAFKQGRDR